MNQEKNKSNLRRIKGQMPKIEIKSHPPEIMDLDEETVAIAKAKLAGLDFVNIYGDEDRSSSELMVRIQAKKIRELFQSPSELRLAFSSEKQIAHAQKYMIIDGIDLEFVKEYCQKRQLDFSCDVEALMIVGFESHRSGEANV